MQITSDLPSSVQKMATPPTPAMEAGERAERIPDNEAIEAGPSKASLQAYQGKRVDVTA